MGRDAQPAGPIVLQPSRLGRYRRDRLHSLVAVSGHSTAPRRRLE